MLQRSIVFGAVLGALVFSSSVRAVPIYVLNGGNVTAPVESSATDPTPLYGFPTVVGNSLSFSTGPFAAAQAGIGADITSGQLSFFIQADPGLFIESISLDEIGDFLMLGSTAEVTAGGTLVATILDPLVGGFVSDPIDFVPGFPLTGTGSGIWSGKALVDLSNYQATYVRIDLDNSLIAASDKASHAAFIDKKALTVNVTFSQVPEPAALALMGMGMLAVLKRH
ncbi:MAG: PEP-CTERM sorting domain-containing protein [Phycisphaerales bacterium]